MVSVIRYHVRKTNCQTQSIFIFLYIYIFFDSFLFLGQEHLLDVCELSILLVTATFTEETEP